MDNGTIVQINELFEDSTNIMFEGLIWKTKKPIFTYPSNSKHFKIWQLESEVSHRSVSDSVNKIDSKMVKLSQPLKDNVAEKVYAIPFYSLKNKLI